MFGKQPLFWNYQLTNNNMKKLLLIITSFACFMATSYAGQNPPDSNQVKKLLTQAQNYQYSSDTFQILMTEALGTAEKIKYTKGIIAAQNGLADYYFQTGNLSNSLQHLLNVEQYAIAANDSVLLFNILRLEYTIYARIGDINMFRKTLMRRQYIIDHQGIKGLTDTSYQVLSQYNSLAQLYAAPQINKPDSVEYFYRKIKNLGPGTQQANLWLQLGSGGIGKVLLAKNKFDSAIYYLRVALDAALEAKRLDNYYAFMISLSDAFNKARQHDSAWYYAYKTFNGAAHNSLLSLLATSSGQLAAFYRNDKKYDSAVKYMLLETKYKDSVTGTKALNSIQFITKDYQLKSLEKQKEKEAAIREYKASLKNYFFIGGVLLLLVIIAVMHRINQQRTKSKQQIETAYHDLKAMQAQLIQSEKMASLGELTAGIAHEIQNPLNFVNNFSEVNRELIAEMKEELSKGNMKDANLLANDI
jgi:signal transduction histidine kinase